MKVFVDFLACLGSLSSFTVSGKIFTAFVESTLGLLIASRKHPGFEKKILRSSRETKR